MTIRAMAIMVSMSVIAASCSESTNSYDAGGNHMGIQADEKMHLEALGMLTPGRIDAGHRRKK